MNDNKPLDPNIVPVFRLELVRERDIAVPRKLTTVESVAAVLHELTDKSPVERLIVMYMDGSATLVGAEEVAVGGLEHVQVEMSSLFRGAIVASVKRIVLGHNHSQGDVIASDEDLYLTASAVQYGMMLGIHVWDHVVVSPKGDHYSIYDHPERMADLAIRRLSKSRYGLPPNLDPTKDIYKDVGNSIRDLLSKHKYPPR